MSFRQWQSRNEPAFMGKHKISVFTIQIWIWILGLLLPAVRKHEKVTSFCAFFFSDLWKIDLQCFLKLQQEADKIVDFDTLQGKSVQCYFTSYQYNSNRLKKKRKISIGISMNVLLLKISY